MAARDASPTAAHPTHKLSALVRARPAWLRRIERAMRPLDYLPRRGALGAGAAAGAAAGLVLGWTGEPWTLGAGAAFLAAAGWLVASAEAVAVVERAATAPQNLPPSPDQPPEPVDPPPPDPRAMIDLPGGRFWMGSDAKEQGAYRDEHPRHEVDVAPFSVAKYTVTQKLYREVTGNDPGSPKGDDLPANNVSWLDAVAFCNQLSELEGLTPVYLIQEASVTWDRDADGYRLPTEAEWEYACRAGTKTAYSFGDDEAMLGDHAWYDGNANDVQPVGRKNPNPWGLHDMHGNVWEWCWDSFVAYPYKGPEMRPPAGGDRVLRGGSFDFGPGFLRSAFRFRNAPVVRGRRIGFRCVRGPRRQP